MPNFSKFAAYLKERENVDLIETDKGFAIYNITDTECYLRDIYVLPEYRQAKVASQIADQVCEIAKLKGCTQLTGSVAPQALGATDSLRVLLGYGMKLHSSTNQIIWFIKDI